MNYSPYVVITPARNEADYIEHTLRSMAAQTVPPLKWVIVNDASTDGTDELVQCYAECNDWIELLQKAPDENRSFGAKVRAFNAGYEQVKNLDYRFIGNVDADVAFDPDQFEFLLKRFEERPHHGLLGTVYTEPGDQCLNDRFRNSQHVNGSMQLFRREAFEAIGGFEAIPLGGIDWLAELKVRKAGWKTHSFAEKTHLHLKPVRVGTGGLLGTRFRYGYRDYVFGSHPVFQVVRVINQMRRRPLVVGGLGLGVGYVWGAMMRSPRLVAPDLVAYYRQEQLRGLRRRIGLRGAYKYKDDKGLHDRVGKEIE